jgi:hypothetical protein
MRLIKGSISGTFFNSCLAAKMVLKVDRVARHLPVFPHRFSDLSAVPSWIELWYRLPQLATDNWHRNDRLSDIPHARAYGGTRGLQSQFTS